jgi:hypothetical protein
LSKHTLNISSYGPKDNNIGAYLVLLQEIIILSKIYKKKKINFSFINKINKNFFKEKFINFSNLKINLVKKHKNKFINFSYIKKRDKLYSLSLISSLYKKYKIKPKLEWNKKTIRESNRVIKKFNLKNFIVVNLKKDLNSSIASAKINVWKKVFKFIIKKYKIIIVGNDGYHDQINDKIFKKRILFLDQHNISLAAQLNIINSAKFFLGTASGICMGSCFSDTPYGIFKHPKHHSNEMKKELFGNHLVFASKKQFIFRKIQSYNNIISAIRMIIN